MTTYRAFVTRSDSRIAAACFEKRFITFVECTSENIYRDTHLMKAIKIVLTRIIFP